jgi:type 1 glutamine amidotransferase
VQKKIWYERELPMMRRLISAIIATLVICCVARGADNPIKVLIITGDHGHAWKETTPVLKDVLSKAGMEVDVTENPRLDLVPDKLAKYQVLLFNYRDTPKGAAENPNSSWSDDNKKAFMEAVHGGIGLVIYHHASSAFRGDSGFDREFETLSAGGWRNQGFHGAMHEFVVSTRQEHPITRGITSFSHGRDELYQNSLLTPGSEVLVTAYSDAAKDPKNTGKDEPMVWINKYGDGRVVQNALGHDTVAMQSPGFQILLTRCVEWAATGETTSEAPDLK